jgi:lipoprotein-anchoring transpeptidase ErfK/SrfK
MLAFLAAILVAISATACGRADKPQAPQGPTIEASPVQQREGQWTIVSSDLLSLTVTAQGAQRVRLLYRPVAAEGRQAVLKTITSPADPASGKFSAELKPGPDFAGHVWAEIFYPDKTKKKTEPLALAAEAVLSPQSGQIPLDSIGGSAGTDESARSDKITGGPIKQAELKQGEPRIWITVNVPAFRLTLWQDGSEVKTYQIGVGRKNFPIRVGERKATQIIWNPEWVPPDSPWVLENENVEPGERIEADDPRNPLGKVKIPLGDGYLIHQAARPSDIGRLVSHGCIRMLTEDLFDLAEKIVVARRLPVTIEQIERAKASSERLAVRLDPPVWVDINYDTEVVEGGVLHLYPDVYGRGGSTVEKLRADIEASGVEATALDDQTLKQIIGRVSAASEFVVSLADLKAGRALTAGRDQPLTDYSADRRPGPKKSRRSSRSR